MAALAHGGLFDLSGRVAVVTGGMGKLGPIWIEALLESGASVASLDLANAKPSPEFLALTERYGRDRLRSFSADVTDRRTLEASHEECLASGWKPDILINNAGIDQPPGAGAKRYLVNDIPADVCQRILEVNVVGAFQTTQIFTRTMLECRSGSVINIGSLYASVSPDCRFYDHFPGDPPFLKPPMYGASKAALINLSRYLATHLGPNGVRVNTLSPGGVLGGQDEDFRRKFCERVPMQRMAVASDLKGPLVFLASDASAYVNGIEVRVDGGYTAW